MKNLDNIAEDLFNKIRGRFPSVTIGDEEGKLTDDPSNARFFDFDYKSGGESLGRVSVSVTEDSVSIMYTNDFVENASDSVREDWYGFLKQMRTFSKKRLLDFDTRNITKSNLDKRDYKFLSKNKFGDTQMSESKLFGTSQVSYQKVGEARLNIRHRKPVDPENSASRTRNIDKIYIESPEGERFKYPYRHLAGARAMARHVSEGGTPYDSFGQHVVTLSEELSKLKRFKTHVNRSKVMAEGLSQYMDIIESRVKNIKHELESIQKPNRYSEIAETFETVQLEEVPENIQANWIDELTIRQFNEELKDVFPYVYRLIGEHTQSEEITPDSLEEEMDLGDTVHIKSKNITGMYYGEKDGEIIVRTPDGVETADADDVEQIDSENTKEPTEKQLPITEFILSHYDKETGSWPRGETAVLTGVEKDYGDQYIETARQFIERINQTFEQYTGVEEACGCEDDTEDERDTDEDFERLKNLAGV